MKTFDTIAFDNPDNPNRINFDNFSQTSTHSELTKDQLDFLSDFKKSETRVTGAFSTTSKATSTLDKEILASKILLLEELKEIAQIGLGYKDHDIGQAKVLLETFKSKVVIQAIKVRKKILGPTTLINLSILLPSIVFGLYLEPIFFQTNSLQKFSPICL